MFPDVFMGDEGPTNGKVKREPDENYQKMEAGYNALFANNDQEAMDSYFNVASEQEDLGYSPSSDRLKTQLHEEETDLINEERLAVATDLDLDLGIRGTFASLDISDERQETTMQEKLAYKFLSEEDEVAGIPATDEYEASRSSALSVLKKVSEYNQMAQALVDGRDYENRLTGVAMAADLATMVLPFVEQSNVAEALSKIGAGTGSLQSFFLLGSAKQEFFNAFKRMPLSARMQAAEQFVQIASEANRTLFMTNGLLEKQMVEELLYGGTYSEVDKWVDNLVSIADASILGKPAAWLIKANKTRKLGKELAKLEKDIISDMEKESVRGGASPTSPLRTASQTNSQKSKAMFDTIVKDESGEAAQALGGASREDIIADELLPEMKNSQGIRQKTHNIDATTNKEFLVDSEIKTAIDESAVPAHSRQEVKSAAAHVVERLNEAIGVTSREGMFTFDVTPTGARIKGAYGPPQGAWTSAEDAFEKSEIAFREHGITRADMKLLKQDELTGRFREALPDEDLKDGNFMMSIDYDYKVRYSDVNSWDQHSPAHNFLDRIPLLAKMSVNRHFFDPASILDKEQILGANAAVDRTAKITKDFLRVGKAFSDGFKKANKESKAKMFKYVLDANENQIPFNINTLKGEYGFNTTEIATLQSFREYWDTVWVARNLVDVKALRNRGFGVYENAKTQDRLVTRHIGKGQVNRSEKIYDPQTGKSSWMSEEELAKLYDDGHTISKLRKPQNLGGTTTDHIIVKNDNSWRSIRDTDAIYPYREGYFQRAYTSPHFVVKEMVTEGGTKYHKAVATAETMTDANTYIKGLQKADSEGVYFVRGDVKNPKERADLEMDTYETSGHTTSRLRGEKLEDATAAIMGTENTNVMGPVDSIIASSRSLGHKIGMGDTIEAMKKRFLAQYKNVLKEEKGMTQYPRNMDEIGIEGREFSKEAADARSTYEYISYLEFGYVNSMDSMYKGVMKGIAEIAGGAGARSLEKGATKASQVSPVGFAKNLAFQMYIATNPLRQLALNAHQSTLLTSVFPKYVFGQKLVADMHAFMYLRMGVDVPKTAAKLTGKSVAELKLMYKEFQKSGLPASIDQNNLLRGSLMDIAESSRYKGDVGIIQTPLSISRRVGFDFGEELNLTTAWLAHYDEAKNAGKVLDATEYSRISGKARNFTFSMNRAGDMPYNSNSLSLILQYMQVPHKSLLQMTTNRVLTGKEKSQLFLYNALMFTLPPAAMYEIFGDVLPDKVEHPDAHDAMVMGLEFLLFNKALELATGEEVRVNFGSLAAADSYGMYELMKGILTTDVGSMLSNTPAGQLFAGHNPRITNLLKSIASFAAPNLEITATPASADMVFRNLANLSSGMSNAFKAKMALEYHKAYGSRGQVTDPSVSTPEAIMMLFGFNTMEQVQRAAVSQEIYHKSKEFRDDVNTWYNEVTRALSQSGVTIEEADYVVGVLSQAQRAFGDSEEAYSIIKGNLDRDAKKGTAAIFDYIMKKNGILGGDGMITLSNSLPGYEKQHEQIKNTVETIRKFNNEGVK